MRLSEVRQLDKRNYEYIKALNLIAHELIHDGEIISYNSSDKRDGFIHVKNDNIIYTLEIVGGDTCKSITWSKI